MEPRVEWDSYQHGMRAVVYPFEGTFVDINVGRDQSIMNPGKWEEPTVRWPSIGEKSPDEARQFAAGLVKAAEIADQMRGEVKTFRVTVKRPDGQPFSDGELEFTDRRAGIDEEMARKMVPGHLEIVSLTEEKGA